MKYLRLLFPPEKTIKGRENTETTVKRHGGRGQPTLENWGITTFANRRQRRQVPHPPPLCPWGHLPNCSLEEQNSNWDWQSHWAVPIWGRPMSYTLGKSEVKVRAAQLVGFEVGENLGAEEKPSQNFFHRN